MANNIIKFFLENKLVTVLLLLLFVGWGVVTAPFTWQLGWLPRDPVPVDAIPDIGENQQIVFTEWMGRSPQDVEDQVTYPLTTALLGIPGVKTIRSNSMFGFSSIYVIFGEDVEFYWSRTRILEKLNSLPRGTLPAEVSPQLGPDATALGQIFWYTLEGRDENGKPAGGWDPHELRSIQDFYVKYSLTAARGVSEVASIGGFVKEYQVDLDPNALKAHNISLMQVMNAIKESNIDVGAKTLEINRVEYFVRGLGYLKSIADLEESVITVRDNTPIRIKDVAFVTIGPATRRGALDKTGAEAVGGVVVARYGDNPLAVINNVKETIEKISPGLPEKELADGSISKVTIVPFYDRTRLIKETLGTLEHALTLEILITILVVIVMLLNLRASFLISGLLPVAVLMCFIAMQQFGVDANIVALSGIAIAIGTMVDMGVILTENIYRHLQRSPAGETKRETIFRATSEVSGAVITAVATTIVSFLPVFTMEAAEGKLFRPLAFTKTFALFASILVALLILPAFAEWFIRVKSSVKSQVKMVSIKSWGSAILLMILGVAVLFWVKWAGVALIFIGIYKILQLLLPPKFSAYTKYLDVVVAVLVIGYLLTQKWLPLGPGKSLPANLVFVAILLVPVFGLFTLIVKYYQAILGWCLRHKAMFIALIFGLLFWGFLGWSGTDGLLSTLPGEMHKTDFGKRLSAIFPGTGSEFMPSLDEGAFLLMPSSMPHAGIEENLEVVRHLDMAVAAIPEVENVVGKLGRVESALDPAPISMYENIINYKPEYVVNDDGDRMRFRADENGHYLIDFKNLHLRYDNSKNVFFVEKAQGWVLAEGEMLPGDFSRLNENFTRFLIPDKNGKFFRNWREHIHSPDDIWKEIVSYSKIPGVTSAPKLQPIETRLVMLQTGMRAPMGIKIYGPDLETIQQFGFLLESQLQQIPQIKSETVFADRIVGKPYLQIRLNRKALARYGLTIKDVQHYIEIAIGGMPLTTTVEGRERYGVRARYARDFRDSPEALKNILIPAGVGLQIPLGELASIEYQRGPQSIKSENTFLVGYVIFDKYAQFAEVDVVTAAQEFIETKIANGDLKVPAGLSYQFTGNYENQLRASKRLAIVVPISLAIIFLILYFQFRSVVTTMMIFSSIIVALAGGFIMIWFYGQSWFMNFSMFGANIRDLFQMQTINLSVAVWVGFIALFGIASDGGVVMATYLQQVFERNKPATKQEVRQSVIEAGQIRIQPTLMTTATTMLALLPVLTSTGRGADIMVPMAIPSFGGMIIQIITLFVVPVLYSFWMESKVKKK